MRGGERSTRIKPLRPSSRQGVITQTAPSHTKVNNQQPEGSSQAREPRLPKKWLVAIELLPKASMQAGQPERTNEKGLEAKRAKTHRTNPDPKGSTMNWPASLVIGRPERRQVLAFCAFHAQIQERHMHRIKANASRRASTAAIDSNHFAYLFASSLPVLSSSFRLTGLNGRSPAELCSS